MCDAGPRYAPVITGHTVLTRAVTNVLPQAGLSCYQGVANGCALLTTRLGISGAMAPPRGEDARRAPLRGGRGATDKRSEGDQPKAVNVRLRRAERNPYRTFSGL